MGKSSSQTIGYHYRVAYHIGLTRGPIDAFLEFRAADKTAWDGRGRTFNRSIDNPSLNFGSGGGGGGGTFTNGSGNTLIEETVPATGPITSSQRIYIRAPNLFGGIKDQGGIDGPVDLMFGEATQLPNPYLQSIFGDQTAAWRGLTTLVFAGGRYGAMNPMPQKPSYKIRKIIEGWDEPGCWYPEKAPVPISSVPEHTVSILCTVDSPHVFTAPADVATWSTDPVDYTTASAAIGDTLFWPTGDGATGLLWIFVDAPGGVDRAFDIDIKVHYDDSGKVIGHSGVGIAASTPPPDLPSYFRSQGIRIAVPQQAEPFQGWVALACVDARDIETGDPLGSPSNHKAIVTPAVIDGAYAMNPAHALYYVRTDSEKGREPRANINEASLTAAADRLYSEGFGLCWEYDPTKDTPDSFEQRICRIIGGSFERSIVDGQWYLDLARGDYDIESLPILGDDDILEFRELPTTLDRATNSIAVRYFDPERKETVITTAVRALGLIRRFGEIHETLDFPEIPTGSLAVRVADREGRARVTPTRTFEIVTTPRMKALRRNQYFRLQSPKRGIADMVCIVGEKQNGTLASGAIRWKVSQDVYSLPDTSYVEIEEGVDTRPPQVPVPIVDARAFEAPYIDVCALLPRTELDALPADVGYLFAVAAWPGVGLNYAMCVLDDGATDYRLAGSGAWCPTATVAGATAREDGPTAVALASGARLDSVAVGMAVLWDDEWCRVDAFDADAMTATLARGCADTVPQMHADASGLWFVGGNLAADTTEYTDGEQIDVKLLPSTGSQQLPLSLATAMPLEFGGRQARPYPPAALTINGQSSPIYLTGTLTLGYVHRDRVLQADQLVDQAAASIGPEAGTTTTVRCYLDGVLDDTQTGITGTAPVVTPSGDGLVRIEVEAVRDGLASWQMQVREFGYTTTPAEPWELQDGDVLHDQAGHIIFLTG